MHKKKTIESKYQTLLDSKIIQSEQNNCPQLLNNLAASKKTCFSSFTSSISHKYSSSENKLKHFINQSDKSNQANFAEETTTYALLSARGAGDQHNSSSSRSPAHQQLVQFQSPGQYAGSLTFREAQHQKKTDQSSSAIIHSLLMNPLSKPQKPICDSQTCFKVKKRNSLTSQQKPGTSQAAVGHSLAQLESLKLVQKREQFSTHQQNRSKQLNSELLLQSTPLQPSQTDSPSGTSRQIKQSNRLNTQSTQQQQSQNDQLFLLKNPAHASSMLVQEIDTKRLNFLRKTASTSLYSQYDALDYKTCLNFFQQQNELCQQPSTFSSSFYQQKKLQALNGGISTGVEDQIPQVQQTGAALKNPAAIIENIVGDIDKSELINNAGSTSLSRFPINNTSGYLPVNTSCSPKQSIGSSQFLNYLSQCQNQSANGKVKANYIYKAQLSKRKEAEDLAQWLQFREGELLSQAELTVQDIFTTKQQLYQSCISEILRQTAEECQERAYVLQIVWEGQMELLTKVYTHLAKSNDNLEAYSLSQQKALHEKYQLAIDKDIEIIREKAHDIKVKDQQIEHFKIENHYMNTKCKKFEMKIELLQNQIISLTEHYTEILKENILDIMSRQELDWESALKYKKQLFELQKDRKLISNRTKQYLFDKKSFRGGGGGQADKEMEKRQEQCSQLVDEYIKDPKLLKKLADVENEFDAQDEAGNFVQVKSTDTADLIITYDEDLDTKDLIETADVAVGVKPESKVKITQTQPAPKLDKQLQTDEILQAAKYQQQQQQQQQQAQQQQAGISRRSSIVGGGGYIPQPDCAEKDTQTDQYLILQLLQRTLDGSGQQGALRGKRLSNLAMIDELINPSTNPPKGKTHQLLGTTGNASNSVISPQVRLSRSELNELQKIEELQKIKDVEEARFLELVMKNQVTNNPENWNKLQEIVRKKSVQEQQLLKTVKEVLIKKKQDEIQAKVQLADRQIDIMEMKQLQELQQKQIESLKDDYQIFHQMTSEIVNKKSAEELSSESRESDYEQSDGEKPQGKDTKGAPPREAKKNFQKSHIQQGQQFKSQRISMLNSPKQQPITSSSFKKVPQMQMTGSQQQIPPEDEPATLKINQREQFDRPAYAAGKSRLPQQLPQQQQQQKITNNQKRNPASNKKSTAILSMNASQLNQEGGGDGSQQQQQQCQEDLNSNNVTNSLDNQQVVEREILNAGFTSDNDQHQPFSSFSKHLISTSKPSGSGQLQQPYLSSLMSTGSGGSGIPFSNLQRSAVKSQSIHTEAANVFLGDQIRILSLAQQQQSPPKNAKKYVQLLNRTLTGIYSDQIRIIKNGERLLNPLHVAAYEFFIHRFGLKTVSEKKLAQELNQARLLAGEYLRFKNFTKLFFLPGVMPEHCVTGANELTFYLQCLTALDESKQSQTFYVDKLFTTNQKVHAQFPRLLSGLLTEEEIWIKVASILRFYSHHGGASNNSPSGQQQQGQSGQINVGEQQQQGSKISEGQQVPMPMPDVVAVIDIEQILEICLDIYRSQSARLKATFFSVFLVASDSCNPGQCSGGGWITTQGFYLLLKNFHWNFDFPSQLILLEQFRANVDNANEKCMSFEQFATFCNRLRLLTPETQRYFQEASEEGGAATSSIEDSSINGGEGGSQLNAKMEYFRNNPREWRMFKQQVKLQLFQNQKYSDVHKKLIEKVDRYLNTDEAMMAKMVEQTLAARYAMQILMNEINEILMDARAVEFAMPIELHQFSINYKALELSKYIL